MAEVVKSQKTLCYVAKHLNVRPDLGLHVVARAASEYVKVPMSHSKRGHWTLIMLAAGQLLADKSKKRTAKVMQAVSPESPAPVAVSSMPKRNMKKKKALAFVQTDDFLLSYEWRRLRMEAIKLHGRRCLCCGATPADGTTQIHVDHIKPRKDFPELALELSNLQVLCGECNHGKGNWDRTDWR